MTPPKPPEPRAGRYTMERAAAEVARVIQAKPRGTHVAVARELNISSQQLTHRCSNDYKFTVEELGIIADFLGAPTGWPFVPWPEAEERDDAWRNRKRR
jgi:hypothetical protein